MNQLPKILLMLSMLAVLLPASAVVDVQEFSSEEKRERYLRLVEELRCPKCQNQNLAGSNSPIAQDLRRELYRLVEQGRSEAEIKAFMVQRYGDFVLYRPPVQRNTLLLWWGPPVMFGLAVLIVLIIVWRRRRMLDAEGELSPEDQARLDRLLAEEGEGETKTAKSSDQTTQADHQNRTPQ